ncbi:MAG: N-acetyl-gamma-glutamyl-phosphate reductase [Lewinellaceae bacterium]|nr:N-acetyl-gamma-glutamyl-phosphate reductase [Phaeodactylibacter sp.]MCB9347775.1 N-acetyl-gamma-glutamyl-phosphate reductase [Lewinellaceae bacterium]
MIKVGIVGATGYTGSELVRLLYNHPEIDIRIITSESRKGARFSDVHPHFQGLADYELQPAHKILEENLDAVFLALPHGVSMSFVEKYEGSDFLVIDLSGDFRLSAPGVYESWYAKRHTFPKGFEQAAYGLPELHRDKIRKSRLVANPGCYPTSAILGLAPLVKANIIVPGQVVVDSKSGVTGAGVKATPTTHYSNVSDNFKAYGLKRHRHTIEIEEQLSGLSSNGAMQIQFTPHLLPVDRGILSTIYTQPREGVTENQLKDLYTSFYEGHPFVRLRKAPPALKDVRGSNFCDLFVTYDDRTNRIITVSVIDNLVKGAAGQAMQNMNLMFGLEETTGLTAAPLNP